MAETKSRPVYFAPDRAWNDSPCPVCGSPATSRFVLYVELPPQPPTPNNRRPVGEAYIHPDAADCVRPPELAAAFGHRSFGSVDTPAVRQAVRRFEERFEDTRVHFVQNAERPGLVAMSVAGPRIRDASLYLECGDENAALRALEQVERALSEA